MKVHYMDDFNLTLKKRRIAGPRELKLGWNLAVAQNSGDALMTVRIAQLSPVAKKKKDIPRLSSIEKPWLQA